MSLPYRSLLFRALLICIALEVIIVYAIGGKIVSHRSVASNRPDVIAKHINSQSQLQTLELNAQSSAIDGFGSNSYGVDDFVYKNRRWAGDCPEVKYKINVNTDQVNQGDGTEEDFRQAIINAARSWNAVEGASYILTYDGETDATITGYNGTNEIIFSQEGLDKPSGLARIWFTSDFIILEADIWINSDYQWDTTGSPSLEELDLQSVLLHEFGHWLALGHDDSPEAVMFATVTLGSVRRELHQHEINGISFIYPKSTNSNCLTGDVPVSTATPLPSPTPTATPSPISTNTPTPLPTSSPVRTLIPTLTSTSASTPVVSPVALETPLSILTPNMDRIPSTTVTLPSTLTPLPSGTAMPDPSNIDGLSANYETGASGSFFTINGAGYAANQDLTFVVVNNDGVTVQEQKIKANSLGDFSIIIDTAGAPSGRYIVETAPYDAINVGGSVHVDGVHSLVLSIWLDSAEPLRAQEIPVRSPDSPLFRFPIIDTGRLLYLPFTY